MVYTDSYEILCAHIHKKFIKHISRNAKTNFRISNEEYVFEKEITAGSRMYYSQRKNRIEITRQTAIHAPMTASFGQISPIPAPL